MTNLFSLNQEKKVLRPHQVRAIELARQSLGKGNKSVVIQGPTGFGKTLVASNIIRFALDKGRRVIFTVPQKNLVNQTVDAFEAEGIKDIGVMQGNHPRLDPNAMVQVATVQTLARRDIPEASLIVADECHINSSVIDKLMEEDDIYFVGLSATPWRKGMGHKWQDLVIPITIGELIDQGYLSKFVVYAPSTPDLSSVKTKSTINGTDYDDKQLQEIMGESKLVADIVQTWLAKGENRPTLCFCVNRAHASIVHNKFLRAGIASEYCDGMTDETERGRINRRFREGEVKVICSVRTMTTGVDLPVSCIIDAAPTKSEMLHVQKIGRGLRVNEGTEDLIILDHASNSYRLGLVTDIKYDELDKTEVGERQKRKRKEKLPKDCSQCDAVFSGLICPQCGHERKPVANVETEQGDLVEVGERKKRPTKEEQQRFYSMALWLAKDRGKPKKYADGLFKGKFDKWPRKMKFVEMFPDKAFFNWEKSRRIAYAKMMEKKKHASH